jgi:pimeloyl-ACP methyl ester carboxylesterase
LAAAASIIAFNQEARMLVDVNGTELHYELAGDGEPLLWLHGFLGCGADWRHVLETPPAGYQLIAPDLRGHGASTNPSGVFSFREAARDISALLRHLGVARVKAIGVSGGGIVLLHLATAEPASIASMVVVSAPPYFPEQARAIQRQTSEATLGDMTMAHMRRSHPRGEPQIQQLLAQTRALADRYDDVNFTPPYLSTIAADTMIVFGDSDPLYPVSLAMELHEAIPRSRLWIVPGGGHGPVFGRDAPRFAETALGFLGADRSAARP